MSSCYTPESWKRLSAAVAKALQSGESYELDLDMVRPDGTIIHTSARGEADYDASGKIVGLQGTVQDITERKQAEEELRSTRDRLQFLLTSSHAVIYTSKPGGDFQTTYISDNVTALLGYEPSDFIDNKSFWADHLHPDDKERVLNALLGMGVSGRQIHEYRFLHKDGSYRWIHDEVTLVWNGHDQPLEIIGYRINITERKQIEEAKDRLSRIVEMATDFISIADHDGRVNYINPAGRKMMGISPDEDVSDLYIPYIFTDTAQDILMNEAISAAILSGVWNGETVMKSCEGKDIPVSMALIVYKDPSDNIESFFIIARDISERKYIEELRLAKFEAERASAVKSEFLAKMSHELRTPLNAVMGFSELLRIKAHGELNEKQEHYVNNIFNSGEHLLGIISDMLDLVKVESGEILPLVIESFSAPEAIEKTMVFVNGKAEKKNIMIKKEIDPELDMISADKLRFKQILMNLIDNAIKFSKPEGGTVTITAGKAGDMAQFSVTDTGIGIKEEDKEKLFSLFHQVDSGFSRKYGGTGIGLAITKQLVEQHGGKIWVESKYGEGSTFTFTLPLGGKKEKSEH
jgi:PAS domain S-box-containing protein